MKWERTAFKYFSDQYEQSPADDEMTEEAREYLGEGIAKYKVQPVYQEISCKRDICRYRFAFRNTAEMEALSLIPRAPGWKVNYSPPEPTQEGVGIVIYSMPDKTPAGAAQPPAVAPAEGGG